ncbi:MAG TPA: DUF6351 family protein [Blastocatellia bacterium]|nr:DUF6351 family protein [Blastocatellia bacterium]
MIILVLSCCLRLSVNAQEHVGLQPEEISETGTINGAVFRLAVPAKWNRSLIMYAHGYLPAGSTPDADDPGIQLLRSVFVKRGYAFAHSGYRAQGWSVKEATEDTEALRRHFVSKYGQPRETYLVGHSMGAVVVLAAVEKYPAAYNGALPLCGPLDIILHDFQERLFGLLVTFEYYFPGQIGPPVGLPKGARLDPAKVRAAIEAAPEKAAALVRHYGLATADDLVEILPFYYEINRELQERCGGNPFDNRHTIYDGFGDDAALNRGVKRYAADAKASEYLGQYYTPTGRISDPVLALHTTYDPLVPARYLNRYASIARLAGTQDLFVAKFVAANGHCNFTIPQITGAFDQLTDWARQGKRPESGEIK